MGYVGNQTTNAYSSIDKQTITGNGGASYTLTHAVANAQEIEVFVNNVRQEAGVAYTVNGTALSMTGNVASTDDFYVIYQGKALQTVVPPDGSVSTAKIANNAVTMDKLATSGTLPALDGSALTGVSKGILVADHWYLNADHTTDGTSDLTAWSQVTTTFPQTAKISGMSHSSGIFTFPQTGLYKVSFAFFCRSDAGDHMTGIISVTTDNSTYNNVVVITHGDSDNRNGGAYSFGFINVTDTSNVKVKFVADSMNTSSYVLGSSSEVRTSVMFERIADAQ